MARNWSRDLSKALEYLGAERSEDGAELLSYDRRTRLAVYSTYDKGVRFRVNVRTGEVKVLKPRKGDEPRPSEF